MFDSFCRSINRRVVIHSNILTMDNLDISFVGSFAEFVCLWLACVAGSCDLNWSIVRSACGAILLSEIWFVFQS